MSRSDRFQLLAASGGAQFSGRVGSVISDTRKAFRLETDAVAASATLEDAAIDMGAVRTAVGENASAVGKVEICFGQKYFVVGTCFRVGADPRRVATARHVGEVLLREGARLRPGYLPQIEIDQEDQKTLRDHRVVFEGLPASFQIAAFELVHGNLDLMLLRLSAPCPRGPLHLAGPRVGSDIPACVIGYPTTAPRVGQEKKKFDTVFGDTPTGIKRASPGLVDGLTDPPSATAATPTHDATTLPGSSGSPVITLDDKSVVGIHVHGRRGGGIQNGMLYLSVALLDQGVKALFERPQSETGRPNLPDWSSAGPVVTGRFIEQGETADDGLEFAVPERSAAPGAFAYAPAVMQDRRDIRDYYYTPSLRVPRATCSAPPIDSDRIMRQGHFADCTGCALATAIEFRLRKQGRDDRVSQRMLYEMARLHDEFIDDEPQGSSLRGAIKGFYHNGVCPPAPEDREAAWHLSVDRAKTARDVSLGAYYRLRPNLPAFQMAIQEAGTVIVSARTHAGWTAPRAGRIRPDRAPRAAHAFVLVGYDSDGFLVQNSWGPKWGRFLGRPGTAHWRYSDWAENVIDAWVIQTAPRAPDAHNLPLRSYVADIDRTVSDLPPEIAALPEPRRMAVIGHVAHAERLGLVEGGRIGLGTLALRETTLYLGRPEVWKRRRTPDPEKPTAYRGLAYVFHDPTLGAEAMARLAGHLVPRLKAAGVYPMNILYGADEIRSLMARMTEEAAFATGLAGQATEDLTAYLERRARTVGKGLVDAFLAGVDEAVRPRGALWQILASFGRESVLPPDGIKAKPRSLHLVAIGAGALAASAAFRDPRASGFFTDDAPSRRLPLDSVALLGAVRSGVVDWPLRRGRKPLEIPLGTGRQLGGCLPAYRGEWCDLLDAMLPGSSAGTRNPAAQRPGADTLAGLAADPAVLNTVLKGITGRSPGTWESF